MPTPNDIPTYILLKDHIFFQAKGVRVIKAGTNFTKSHQFYFEEGYVDIFSGDKTFFTEELIENNSEYFQKKESKTIKEQPIKVRDLQFYGMVHDALYQYRFNMNVDNIPADKYDAVKKAIEFILNPTQTTDSIKEYEIMVLEAKDGALLFKEKYQNKECFTSLEKELKIYSVKRLSDNEVFTVGDKIQHINHTDLITKIDAICEKGGSIYCGGCGLNYIKKYLPPQIQYTNPNAQTQSTNCNEQPNKQETKEVLFTTEDGVNVYRGDSAWETIGYDTPRKVTYRFNWAKPDYHKVFSTEAKAKEYVKLNKPLLTEQERVDKIKDYMNQFPKDMSVKSDWHFDTPDYTMVISKDVPKDLLQFVLKSVKSVNPKVKP